MTSGRRKGVKMPMFEQNKGTKKVDETIVGIDVTLTGNLKSEGNIQINGKVKGTIATKSDIVVGEQAMIDGSVKAKNVLITGTVQGNIETSDDLEISPTGKVFGDLATKNLIIKKGATFSGKSMMGEKKKKETKPVYELEEEPKTQEQTKTK